jgi:transposase-like protein
LRFVALGKRRIFRWELRFKNPLNAFIGRPTENFKSKGESKMKRVDLTQFNEKQIQAIGLLSMPNKGGLQFDEIAEQCGISVRQLHRWRKQPEFKQAIVEQSLENVKEVLPNVLKAHTKQAERGNIKAIELFYKLFGLLVEKQEIEQTVHNKDKDNDQLAKDLADLKSLIDEAKAE